MDKKIKPTDEMVNEAAHALALHATGMALRFQDDLEVRAYRNKASAALRAALNHPDAPGLFADEDDRPWEPLNEGDPLNVGDEVRREAHGITITAVVGRVDAFGNLWTTEGGLLIHSKSGTWHVRRHIQELPTKRHTVIIANDGYEHIEAVVSGVIWRTSEAILGLDGRWHGVWRAGQVAVGSTSSASITPGTWKVDDR